MPEIEFGKAAMFAVPIVFLLFLIAGWMAAPSKLEEEETQGDKLIRDRMNGRFDFRVTEEEERLIKEAAEGAGLSVSAWIRFHLLRLARGKDYGA